MRDAGESLLNCDAAEVALRGTGGAAAGEKVQEHGKDLTLHWGYIRRTGEGRDRNLQEPVFTNCTAH